MTILRSLRSRLLLGAVLWTVGLMPIVHAGSMVLILRRTPFQPHHALSAAHTDDVVRFAVVDNGRELVGALVLMIAGFLLFRGGVVPINQLRTRLAGVHDGRERRLEGRYPTEVQPLVDDLNALLDERERRVARAVAKAGDLAHGLKTPLAVVVRQADRARAAGQKTVADAIDQEIERMRRQIDYHLAHARSAAASVSPTARASIATSAEGLTRALQQLHGARGLRIEISAPTVHAFRGQRQDLDEMLGNLLDNACKWTRHHVRLTSSKDGDRVVIDVDDDGPGIQASMRDAVLQRGVRADETAQGSGLGLAIVRDLAELYGGSISLHDSPMGGARARLTLPAQNQ